MQDIARRVDKRHQRTQGDVADDINAVVFGELGFEREIDSGATRFFQMSSVLSRRRGSCLGLGALYLAIARAPRRAPRRHPSARPLLRAHARCRRATTSSCSAAARPCPTTGTRRSTGRGPGRARPIPVRSPRRELGAIHWYNRGNDLRASGDLAAAEQAYARAAREFPGFAEAHASLGAVQQLRGAFAEAALSYQQAARAWPELPGLAGNLELLQRQLAASGP